MDISINPIDIAIGLGIGYYFYRNGIVDVKNTDSSEDLRNSFNPTVFANKKDVLSERHMTVMPSSDPAKEEALMDQALKITAYKQLRRPDLRAMESGIARTAGQKLIWKYNWEHPRSMLTDPEPEDAQ